MNKAVVVLSGGQDSSTCAFWAAETFDEVHCVTIDYGQRHARELEAAKNIGILCKAKQHHFIKLGSILHGSSPLTNQNEDLEQYQNFEQMDKTIGDRVELTFVPMRNAIFLSLVANYAAANGINNMITGVCQADNANYPDCTEDFIDAQEETINHALGLMDRSYEHRFTIHTPLMNLSKKDSIRFSQSLLNWKAYPALAFTHTAYDGAYPPVGHDHATILRAHGFEEANVPDPLILRANLEGLMDLPDTHNYKNDHFNNQVAERIDMLKAELTRKGA